MNAPLLEKLTEIRGMLEEACGKPHEKKPKAKKKGLSEIVAGLREAKKKRRKLTVPEKHQLAVARKTLKMPGAMAGVMGGMSKEQAREIVKKLGEAKGVCPPGQHVCPESGKCVPIGSGDRKGPRSEALEPREATRERMRAIAKRTAGASKKKLRPGEKMVFGKVVKTGA